MRSAVAELDGNVSMHKIYVARVYIREAIMQVAKWGNSLAIRLPAAVVKALELKVGDEVEVQIAGQRSLEIRNRRRHAGSVLAQPPKSAAGRMPADFKFDRLEANERAVRRSSISNVILRI